MLTIYVPGANGLVSSDDDGSSIPENTVWIDANRPDQGEESRIEAFFKVAVPPHEERVEIETSSRLYEEDDAIFMSATVLCGTRSGRAKTTVVTFIIKEGRLATLRYDDPTAFTMARQRCTKQMTDGYNGKAMLLVLLDAIVDRIADVLEQGGGEADRLSHDVFEQDSAEQAERDYDGLIRSLGRLGTLLSKIHESQISLSRLLQFLSTHEEKIALSGSEKATIKSLMRDIRSLSEFATSLDNKITFLLDATTGLVSMQQNRTIKIFSVLAVILMPPTLIASIYGMNFQNMPETQSHWGYPAVLAAMALSAFGTWAFFRWRRWL